jgi:hypothetical protein
MVAQPANLGRVHDLGTLEVLKRAPIYEDDAGVGGVISCGWRGHPGVHVQQIPLGQDPSKKCADRRQCQAERGGKPGARTERNR